MNGYLLSVIGTVLLCSVLTSIAPEGKTASVVKGITKLVCILAIIAPVLQFFKTGSVEVFTDKNSQDFFSSQGIEGEKAFIQYYSEMRIRQTEQALEQEILEKYALESEVCLVWGMYGIQTEEIRIQEIRIQLPENADEEVKQSMWEYLTENYCSEVLIE